MELTESELKKFEAIWKEDHPDEQIDPEQLKEAAMRVLDIVRLLYSNHDPP